MHFLYAAVGACGSTDDGRILKESSIYTAISDGDIMPECVWNVKKEMTLSVQKTPKKQQIVDFSTYFASSWHVLHCITFVLTSAILANFDGG